LEKSIEKFEQCPCGQTIKIGTGNGHYGRCKGYKEHTNKIEKIMTYDYLIEHYINNGESLTYIAKTLGLKKIRLVVKKLKELGIKQRTLKEAKKQRHHIELAKKTSLEKYGVEFHFQKGSPFYEKSLTTIKEKYGENITNVWQAEKIKDKIKNTNLERYGYDNVMKNGSPIRTKMMDDYLEKTGYANPWENPQITEKCLDTKFKNGKKSSYYSKPSQKFFWDIYNKLPKELQEHTYFGELNKEFGTYDKENKKYYYYDFVITKIKFCLEYNGNYYHANPIKYNENWYNKSLKLTAKEIWAKDKIKSNYIKNLGYTLNIIWEKTENDKVINDILKNINSQTQLNIL
jgi:hypothetical protein